MILSAPYIFLATQLKNNITRVILRYTIIFNKHIKSAELITAISITFIEIPLSTKNPRAGKIKAIAALLNRKMLELKFAAKAFIS